MTDVGKLSPLHKVAQPRSKLSNQIGSEADGVDNCGLLHTPPDTLVAGNSQLVTAVTAEPSSPA